MKWWYHAQSGSTDNVRVPPGFMWQPSKVTRNTSGFLEQFLFRNEKVTIKFRLSHARVTVGLQNQIPQTWFSREFFLAVPSQKCSAVHQDWTKSHAGPTNLGPCADCVLLQAHTHTALCSYRLQHRSFLHVLYLTALSAAQTIVQACSGWWYTFTGKDWKEAVVVMVLLSQLLGSTYKRRGNL